MSHNDKALQKLKTAAINNENLFAELMDLLNIAHSDRLPMPCIVADSIVKNIIRNFVS